MAELRADPLGHQPHSQPPGDRRLYTLPLLLNHFRTAHLEPTQSLSHLPQGPDPPKYNWTRDMIELPETSVIAELVKASGMDDTKLEFIAWAFPDVFPTPLPKLAAFRNGGLLPSHREPAPKKKESNQHILSRIPAALAPVVRDRGDDQTYIRPHSAFRPSSRMSRPSEPPADDEYDPHQPAYMGKMLKPDVPSDPRSASQHNLMGPSYSSSQRHSNDSRIPLSANTDLSKLIYDVSQSKMVAEGHKAIQPYEQPKEPHQQFSPQYMNVNHTVSDQNRENPNYENPTRYSSTQIQDFDVRPLSTHSEADQAGRAPRYKTKSTSPSDEAKAANQFLMSLGTSNFNHLVGSTDPEAAPSPTNHRAVDRSQPKEAIGRNGTLPWNNLNVSYGEPDLNVRVSSLRESPSSLSVHRSQNSTVSQPLDAYEANYRRAAANAQTNRFESNHNGRSSKPMTYHPDSSRMMNTSHHASGDDDYERHSIRHNDDIRSQKPPYRPRSTSPSPVTVERTYYRTRSPVEEVRHRPVYLRSPPTRADSHSQRVFYEQPIQDRYEYIEDHEYPDDQYRRRIEYVPIKLGHQSPPEQGRYIMAQPMDQRRRSEYLRFDESFAQQPMYERDGHLYRIAEPRVYPTQTSRSTSAYASDYPY